MHTALYWYKIYNKQSHINIVTYSTLGLCIRSSTPGIQTKYNGAFILIFNYQSVGEI